VPRIVRTFEEPDQIKRVGGVTSAVLEVGGVAVARIVHPPGWRWATDVKPLVGTERCLTRHLGILESGRIMVELADGSTQELAAGDVFDVPPGHDAWVLGDEGAVTIEWSQVHDWLRPRDAERVLATLLFTDIVDSTLLAGRLGDRAWRALLVAHDEIVRRIVTDARGREVKHTGDGFLAIFEGPGRALGAAGRIREGVRALNIEVRQGVHVGEVEVGSHDVGGLAVHEAARVMAAAGPGEVLVSDVARTLAAASGFDFEPRGTRELKGLEGLRALFALHDAATRP
jgi:class 3 adenylate cyclase